MILVPQDLVVQHQGTSTDIPHDLPEKYVVQHHANIMVASDAFTRREQASEAKYIRDKELERYDHAEFLGSPTIDNACPTEIFKLTHHFMAASRS